MMPVSGVDAHAVRPLTAEGAPPVREPEKEARSRRPAPAMDEYVPEEPREPSGRYWIGRDGEGRPKLCFDGPERAEDAAQGPGKAPEAERPGGAKGPEKGGKKGERWICNTDSVDREIERLKKKRQELERQLGAERGQDRAKELERQLAQVERELAQKDNDTYRKQHAVFTRLGAV